MLKKTFEILVILITFFSFAFSGLPEDIKKEKKRTNKIVTEERKKIALNNLEIWFSNNENSYYDDYDIIYPKGSGMELVYMDGPILSGMVGDSVRLIGSTYYSALQPGPSIQGVNPGDPKYKIYMIRKNCEELNPNEKFISGPNYTKADYERDYNEWPIDMGAPYEEDGTGKKVPKFIGDEQAWYIMNDNNVDKYNSFYGSAPCGTEWHALIWVYNSSEALSNVVFKKYTIINKGKDDIQNAYLSYWSDPDVGNPTSTCVGSDTILNMGYVYNANDYSSYGANGPAVGCVYIQGSTVKSNNPNDMAYWNFGTKPGYKNLGMTSFNFFAMGVTGGDFEMNFLGSYRGGVEYYNLIQGYTKNGEPRINPQTEEPNKFMFPGDPVAGTGWTWKDGHYGWKDMGGFGYPSRDVNITISSGPFTLAVGDTQEVVIAIVVGQGADRLSSIAVMKNYALMAQKAYDENFNSSILPISVNEPKDIPTNYSLSQNYPNPFNPTTTIQFSIPKDELVKLTVYDITGRVVKELVNGYKTAGKYSAEFNASGYSSGTYYYKLEAGEYKNIQKMMLIK